MTHEPQLGPQATQLPTPQADPRPEPSTGHHLIQALPVPTAVKSVGEQPSPSPVRARAAPAMAVGGRARVVVAIVSAGACQVVGVEATRHASTHILTKQLEVAWQQWACSTCPPSAHERSDWTRGVKEFLDGGFVGWSCVHLWCC